MRIFWLNGGLHVEPNDDAERSALSILAESLEFVDVDQGVPRSPIGIVNARNEQSIVTVNEPLQVVTESSGGRSGDHLHGPLG